MHGGTARVPACAGTARAPRGYPRGARVGPYNFTVSFTCMCLFLRVLTTPVDHSTHIRIIVGVGKKDTKHRACGHRAGTRVRGHRAGTRVRGHCVRPYNFDRFIHVCKCLLIRVLTTPVDLLTYIRVIVWYVNLKHHTNFEYPFNCLVIRVLTTHS